MILTPINFPKAKPHLPKALLTPMAMAPRRAHLIPCVLNNSTWSLCNNAARFRNVLQVNSYQFKFFQIQARRLFREYIPMSPSGSVCLKTYKGSSSKGCKCPRNMRSNNPNIDSCRFSWSPPNAKSALTVWCEKHKITTGSKTNCLPARQT